MINCILFDVKLNVGHFVFDIKDELICLPNVIKLGEHELNGMNFIEQGSTSYYIDKKTYYILDGDNEWTSYSPSGNNNNDSDEVYINDYEELLNLPSINLIELLGNKTTADLIPIGT